MPRLDLENTTKKLSLCATAEDLQSLLGNISDVAAEVHGTLLVDPPVPYSAR